MKLEDDLWMRKGKPTIPISFDGVIENVIYVYHTIVGESAVCTWNVDFSIGAPADITCTGPYLKLPLAGRPPSSFIGAWLIELCGPLANS